MYKKFIVVDLHACYKLISTILNFHAYYRDSPAYPILQTLEVTCKEFVNISC